jgi:uncharacterized protein (DUF3084 family)
MEEPRDLPHELLLAMHRELTGIRTELTDVRTELTGVRTDLTDARTDLTDVRTELTDVRTDLTDVRTDLTDVRTDLTEFRAETRAGLGHLSGDVVQLRHDVQRIDGRVDQLFLIQSATLATIVAALVTVLATQLAN